MTEPDARDGAIALEADVAGLPDFRRMPVPDAIRWLAEHGEPADPRPDVDTASLVRRFPHLAGVTTADEVVEGPHGPVPVRVYRDAGARRPRRRSCGCTAARSSAATSRCRSRTGSRRARRTRHPRRRGGLHEVPGRRALPGAVDDVLAAWRHVRDAPWNWSGCRRRQVALGGASAGGTLTAGAVARLRDAGEPLPAGLVLVYPLVHPNGPAASGELDPSSPHGQLVAELRGFRRGARGSAGLRRPRRRARIPSDARHGVRARRASTLGEAFATTLRVPGSRQLRLEPDAGTATSTSPATPARGRRSRPSPMAGPRGMASQTTTCLPLHQPGARGDRPDPRSSGTATSTG